MKEAYEMDQQLIKRYREHEDSEVDLELNKNSRAIRHRDEEEASLMNQINELNQALTASNRKYDQAREDREKAV